MDRKKSICSDKLKIILNKTIGIISYFAYIIIINYINECNYNRRQDLLVQILLFNER